MYIIFHSFLIFPSIEFVFVGGLFYLAKKLEIMKELHKEFLEELRQLLVKYKADISLNTTIFDEEVIQIDFNFTNSRDYSKIQLKWIDEKGQHIVD